MIPRRLLALSLMLFGTSLTASAQSPPADRLSDPMMSTYTRNYQYRSRTAPQPRPVDPDADYGYRNPGGVGRVREYYPPGNTFEKSQDPVKVATFGGGPAADSRQSQLAAQSIGNARTATLNNQIDALATPIGFGYGGGFGFGGGFR
jgi:hypothetical protein